MPQEPSVSAGGSSAFAPAIIGLAHGSRRPGVQESMDVLMAAVGSLPGAATVTRTAFLDLCPPDLPTVAAELAAAGHRQAVVVPLLFTQAFHATVDVPDAVTAAGSEGVELLLADILGTGDDVLEVLVAHAAGVDPGRDLLLFAVGSSDAAANDAVADLAARWSSRRAGTVRAGFGTTDPRAPAVLDELAPDAFVVPLFVSPGLLLDALERTAADRNLAVLPPLGDALAPIVHARGLAAAARDPR